MKPICAFDEMCNKILQQYEEDEVVTVGILVADWRQDDAKQYIINYMDRFDRKSGEYIDFYIPGYCEKSNSYVMRDEIPPAFLLRRESARYCFDSFLFEDFIEEMESRMGIRYKYNPLLLLVEVDRENGRGQIEFQDKLVIELDEDTNRGLRRAGELFDEIFEIAKKEVRLDRFSSGVRMHYIKGKAVRNIAGALDGGCVEALADVAGDIMRFRIRT